MSDIGRNEPCPCGSGKKYKKCCMGMQDTIKSRRRDEDTAVRTALDWLAERYPAEMKDAIDNEFFGGLDDDKLAALNELPPEFHESLSINSAEWLLTEAEFDVAHETKTARDLLFGPGGPLLPAHGRNWLEEIAKREMGLYEVRNVRPGEGIEVAHLLDPKEPPTWIRERSGSRSLVRFDVIGARLAQQDGVTVMTGAIYPFARDDGLSCRDEILKELKSVARNTPLAREIICTIIIGRWLDRIFVPRPLPTIVDKSTQEPIQLTTDHYLVTDWGLLASILGNQPDVEGDRAQGWVWFTEIDGDMRRSRAAINVKEPATVEVFCRTLKLADESRAWIERLAANALKYKVREIVDPRSRKALESAAKSAREEVPPEIAAEMIEGYMRNFYKNWADEPIPALGNKTPRQALRTVKGRRAVIDLLNSYEHHEDRRVRDQGGKPFDFGFLWEKLGLKKET